MQLFGKTYGIPPRPTLTVQGRYTLYSFLIQIVREKVFGFIGDPALVHAPEVPLKPEKPVDYSGVKAGTYPRTALLSWLQPFRQYL